MEELYVGPSNDLRGWEKALLGGDDPLLLQLVQSESPGVTYFHIATYINGLHMAQQIVARAKAAGVMLEAKRHDFERVLPILRLIRRRLGWRQREIDIGLLRIIRQSRRLSVVIGAGVTQAAGGPSWSELVRQVLEVALTHGHEGGQMVALPGSAPEPEREGSLWEGTQSYKRQVIRTEHFSLADEAQARAIFAEIDKHGSSTDTESLKRGIQLCSDLFGQDLFVNLTDILYRSVRGPSATHRAIAALAGSEGPGNGDSDSAGWDAIITYNFDDLMGEALVERQIPFNVWAQTGRGMAGTPGLRPPSGTKWVLPVFHLHGFTPRRMFLITDVQFVFSLSQYDEIYSRDTPTVITEVLDEHLANPKHISLYVGCSFSDEAMNALLTKAAQRYPGRFHYALLRWPSARGSSEPSPEEMEYHAARYLQMGLQPIWYDSFEEIPNIIRSLI